MFLARTELPDALSLTSPLNIPVRVVLSFEAASDNLNEEPFSK